MSGIHEIEQLVLEIRMATSSPEAATTERISSLAARYSKECEAVNARLLDASGKLKRGLLPESVHSIEQSPDALNVAAQLELGDLRKSWIATCAMHGVSAVGPITELAAELNRSYTEFRRLEPLIRNHRTLALSRALLAERIAALRDLHSADGMNPSWKAQLQALERVRLEQIESEALFAAEHSNLDALRAILGELEAKERVLPVPSKLISMVRSCFETARRQLATRRIAVIAEELHSARVEADWGRAIALLKEYDSITRFVASEVLESTADSIMQVRAWAEELESREDTRRDFEITIETLDRSMDEGRNFPEIERLHAQAVRMELPIPKAVEQRYLQRRRQVALERTRRYRMIALVVIVVLTFAGVTVTRKLQSHALQASIVQWSSQLAQAIESKDFDSASKLESEVHASAPDVASAPEIVALFEKAKAGRTRELERRSAFVTALEDMRQLKGFEYQAAASIARAKALVQGEEELRLFNAERERLEQERLVDQDTRDIPFRQARTELLESIDAIKSLETAKQAASLREIAARIDRLLETKGISESELKAARAARDAALSNASLIEQSADRERSMLADLEKLPQSTRSVPEILDAYRSFVDRYPESVQALRIDSALQHRAAWEHIAAWSDLATKWSESSIPATKADAVIRAGMLHSFLETVGEHPDRAILDEYEEILKFYATKDTDPTEALGVQAVSDLLSRRWVSDLVCIRDDSGRLLYSLGGSLKKMDQGFYTLTGYVNKLDQLIEESGSSKTAILKPQLISGQEPTTTPAPVVRLANDMRAVVQSCSPNDIDSVHLRLANIIIRDDITDPILRLVLLTDVLQHHSEAGRPDNSAVTSFLSEANGASVQGARVIDMNWADTSDGSTKRGREIASSLLKKAPNFEALSRAWDSRRQSTLQVLAGLTPVGAAWTDNTGSITIRFSRSPKSGPLYSITGSDKHVDVREIGEVDSSGVVRLKANETIELATPVFMRGGITR